MRWTLKGTPVSVNTTSARTTRPRVALTLVLLGVGLVACDPVDDTAPEEEPAPAEPGPSKRRPGEFVEPPDLHVHWEVDAPLALGAGAIVMDPTSGTGCSRDGREHPCAKKHRHQLRMVVTMRDRALEYLERPSDEARTELADLYGAYRELYPPLNSFTLVEVKTAGRDPDTSEVDVDRGDGDGVESEGESSKFQRRYPRLEGFRTDPSWWNVAALEDFDDDTGTAARALQ